MRVSPSHQHYLGLGCTLVRTETGSRTGVSGGTDVHYYGPCRVCSNELRDVNEYGYEDCSGSPYTMKCYGEPDITICTNCAYKAFTGAIDLTGRWAKCGYHCGAERPSAWGLAFFEYKPERDSDNFYCGCMGWN